MIPFGYEWRAGRSGEAVVVATAGPWLQEVLDSGDTVHAWASAQPGADTLRGRGTVYVVDAPTVGPDGRERWAVRHYQRGGAVARLLGDRYLRRGPTRPELEVLASATARIRKVPTPAVIAGVWYPDGAFYRADLVTELLPDATSLADLLFAGPRDETAVELLADTGRLVALAGRNGVLHADLNAMNVVFSGTGDARRGYLLDLDRADIEPPSAARTGAMMLDRLNRSLAKLGNEAGAPLTQAEIAALWDGFRA